MKTWNFLVVFNGIQGWGKDHGSGCCGIISLCSLGTWDGIEGTEGGCRVATWGKFGSPHPILGIQMPFFGGSFRSPYPFLGGAETPPAPLFGVSHPLQRVVEVKKRQKFCPNPQVLWNNQSESETQPGPGCSP